LEPRVYPTYIYLDYYQNKLNALTNVSIGRGSFTPVPTSIRRSSIGAVDPLPSPDALLQKIIDNKKYEDEKKELIR
jgi:hypothetical protein